MAIRIVCLSPYPEDVVRGFLRGRYEVLPAIIGEPPAQERIREAVVEADLVVGDKLHRHRLDRPELGAMRRCRLIQQPAVGFDTIDHAVAAELGIPVANAAGYNSVAVGDWTLMAMLNLIRKGHRVDRAMRGGAGGWPQEGAIGRELGSMTVGIIGLGNAGARVATRLLGFGSRVLYHDVVERDAPGLARVNLPELLSGSDIVSLHTPLEGTTRRLIDADALARMRPGSFLVNAARGPLVDEAALIAALVSGHLAGAGLDVFEGEPLAADSPLRGLDNVFLSPHVAGLTRESEERLVDLTGDNLLRALEGETPINVVNGVEVPASRGAARTG
ncbi:MAG: 2-hydroxyacid dehydrogenase [Candidatus Dormibacteraceae bacterium]